MTYLEEAKNTVPNDGLVSDRFPVFVENVSLTGGAAIKRGMLLVGEMGTYSPVSSVEDAEKSLAIAFADETSDAKITPAYFSGRFHEKNVLICGLSIEDFREGMRKCNLILTKEMEVE